MRFLSNASTLASLQEPGSCYEELLNYLVYVVCKGASQVAHVCRALARRAGFNIAATPPPSEAHRNHSQRRRRKSSRQGSVSVHHMAHHHHHHHHHHYHHCHLGNGSVRGGGSIRCLEGRDVEAGAHSNNGGALVATTGAGQLALAPPPSVTAAVSDTNLAALSNPNADTADSSSVRSVFNMEILRCSPSPTNLGPTPGPFSLAPAPMSRAMKRNSVPFAAPGPKNYPTLQARALAESRRGSVAASTLTNISFNLNIPPMPLERRPSSVVDTHSPAGKQNTTNSQGSGPRYINNHYRGAPLRLGTVHI